jgi:hypothetical protein
VELSDANSKTNFKKGEHGAERYWERERERERERENTFILFKNIFVQCNCPVLILVILISHCA